MTSLTNRRSKIVPPKIPGLSVMPQWRTLVTLLVLINVLGGILLHRWVVDVTRSVHRTTNLVDELDAVHNRLSEIESMHTLYLLTGDPDLLSAYTTVRTELEWGGLTRLESVESEFGPTTVKILELSHRVRDRLAALDYGLALLAGQQRGRERPEFSGQVDRARRFDSEIRELMQEIAFAENQLRNQGDSFFIAGFSVYMSIVLICSVLLGGGLYHAARRVHRELTLRERAEDLLRESEKLERARATELQTLLDTVPAVVLISHDPGSRLVTGSRKAYEVLRLPIGANTSKTALVAPPQHFTLCRNGVPVPLEELPIQTAARTGKPVHDAELEVVFKDGVVRHLIGSAEPLFDEHGTPRGAVAAFTDITARRESDLLLQASDARWRLSLEAGQLGFFEYDYELGTTRWSDSEFALLGFGPSDFIPTPDRFFERVHPDDVAGLRSDWTAALEGERLDTEFRIVRPDGEIRWIGVRGALIVDAAGRKRWFTGVNIDITKSKQIEAELSKAVAEKTAALETLNSFIQAAPMGIAVYDRDYRCRLANQPLAQMTGQSVECLIGHTLEEIVPGIAPLIKPFLVAAFEGQDDVVNHEFEGPDPVNTGQQGAWIESWFPIKAGQGTVPLVGVVVKNITERKRFEKELSQHRDRLQDLVDLRTKELAESLQRLHTSERLAALGTLAAGLGHDLANLVLPIRARLESLALSPLTKEMRSDVVAIGQALDHLSNLSAGMRLMALDPLRARAASEATDLTAWWNEAEGVFRGVLPRHVKLEGEIAPNIGAAVPRHQLLQAVFNLVQNSAEVLSQDSDGCVRITVGVDPAAGDDCVLIRVIDNGPGMTPEVMSRCFEPYFSTKGRAISTGMGLALVRGIVEQCGGTISVDSKVGVGTTFTVQLPRSVGKMKSEARRARKPQSAAISLSEARQAALATMIAQRMQVTVEKPSSDHTPNTAVWITDTAPKALIEHYLAGEPGRRVIYLGGRSFDPTILTKTPEYRESVTVLPARPSPGDLRDALGRALEVLDGAGA